VTLGYPGSGHQDPQADGIRAAVPGRLGQSGASASPTETPQLSDTAADSPRNPTDETAHSGTLVVRVKGTENGRSAAPMRMSWAVGVFSRECSQDDRAPEKRKVCQSWGSKLLEHAVLPIAVIFSAGRFAHGRFALNRPWTSASVRCVCSDCYSVSCGSDDTGVWHGYSFSHGAGPPFDGVILMGRSRVDRVGRTSVLKGISDAGKTSSWRPRRPLRVAYPALVAPPGTPT
jgi:hypothetical protein